MSTLIFDADDTLWENNIYFERAFEEFVSFLDHSTFSPAEVRRGWLRAWKSDFAKSLSPTYAESQYCSFMLTPMKLRA